MRRSGDLSPAYAAGADGLRVMCIGMVGWYHIWQQSWLSPVLKVNGLRLDMMPWVRTGYMFVDLMLMLSGFLLYLPYANQSERDVKAFYVRRGLRILPSYWLCLLLMVIFAVTSSGYPGINRLLPDLLAHLGFVHNLWGFSYTGTLLNNVTWTLAVEVQFYLMLPFLAPVFRKHPLTTYLAMTGVGLSFIYLWTLPMSDTTLFVNRLPNMLVVYANGMLAAHVYVRLAKVERGRIGVALAATLALALSLWGIAHILKQQSWVSGYDGIRAGQLKWRWSLSACGAGALIGGSLSFRGIRALLSNPLVRFLSGISYNFYLWHQWVAVKLKAWRIPPYAAAENPNMAGEMPWQFTYTLTCFGVALALAALITYIVEKPCAKLGRRWLDEHH